MSATTANTNAKVVLSDFFDDEPKYEGKYASVAASAAAKLPNISGVEKKENVFKHAPIYYAAHLLFEHMMNVLKKEMKEEVDGIMPSFNHIYEKNFNNFPSKMNTKVEEFKKQGKTINFSETLKGLFMESIQNNGRNVIPEKVISINDFFNGNYFNDYIKVTIVKDGKTTTKSYPIHILWAGLQKDMNDYFNRLFNSEAANKMWGEDFLPFRMIQKIAKDMGIYVSAGKTLKGPDGKSIVKVTFASTKKLCPLVGNFQNIMGLKKKKADSEEEEEVDVEEEEVSTTEEPSSMTFNEYISKVYDFYYYSDNSIMDKFHKEVKKEGLKVSIEFEKRKEEVEEEEPKTTGGASKYQKSNPNSYANKAKSGK